MRAPSVGQAIALQGRDQNAERLGNLVYQSQQADLNRQMKMALVKGKKDEEDAEKASKKFELPSGTFHRLVLPDVQKTQTKYLEELKSLKLERPNDWQNGVNDLAAKYEQEMSVYTTRSKDLNQYDVITASQDRGNSYFTKNWDKFNRAYESATDYNDLLAKLEKEGWQPDAQLQLRPMGSVSYTPFRNMKPKETLEQNITQMITQLPFKSNETKKAYGYVQGKEVKVRPVTYEPSEFGVSAAEIAKYNRVDPSQVPSIEGVVDNFLMSPDGGVESVIQYADQNNLQARYDEQGQLIPEDYKAIKGHIMNWAKNFASPGITTSMMRPQTMVMQGKDEQVSSATADISPSEIASKEQGQKSYKLGIINYSFDKEPQSIPVNPNNTFTSDFSPAPNTTLTKVQADGVVILAVDSAGKPIVLEQDPKNNKAKVAGADVFVRLRDAEGFYYQKFDKYSNISNTFMKKPNGQLEQEVKKLLDVAAKYDVEITKRKKDPKATFEQIMATPTL
jgi:hypothetical protein